jgi:hypothetical protein
MAWSEIIASMMKMLGKRLSDGDYDSLKTPETPLETLGPRGYRFRKARKKKFRFS